MLKFSLSLVLICLSLVLICLSLAYVFMFGESIVTQISVCMSYFPSGFHKKAKHIMPRLDISNPSYCDSDMYTYQMLFVRSPALRYFPIHCEGKVSDLHNQ